MNGKLLLLDGATGTELNRRGVDTGLPLWSANALTTDAGLNVLRQVHLDYLNAGADILTANTFRTNRRALAGKAHAARELTNRLNADSLLPESRRFTRSNLDRIQTDPTSDSSFGRVPRGKTRPVYTEIPPLMKSGLFGPVRIIAPTN